MKFAIKDTRVAGLPYVGKTGPESPWGYGWYADLNDKTVMTGEEIVHVLRAYDVRKRFTPGNSIKIVAVVEPQDKPIQRPTTVYQEVL